MNGAAREPRATVLRNQERHFRRLLRTVWSRSAFYRDYYSAHGIREHQLADLTVRDLPCVTKNLLMEHFDRVVTDSRLQKAALERWLNDVRDPRERFQRDFIVVHSSGSSGTMGIFVYSRTDWNVMNSVMANRLPPPENYPAGRTRVGFFRVAHGHFAGVATAVHLPSAVYDTLIVSVLDSAEHVIEALQRFQPHRMTGYSSSIAPIAQWAIEGRLCIAPQRIFVSGDLLTPAIRETIRRAWRAPITNLYGASESLFLGMQEIDDDEMSIMDDLNIFEAVDDEGNEVAAGVEGRVVITNLYNHTLPILRYELGDVVVKGSALPSGFSGIREIRPGKTSDELPILQDDGTPGMLSARALSSFYAPGLERAQFICLEPGRIAIDYVAGETIDAEVAHEFRRILALTGASRTAVATRRVSSIARDPATGKVRLVVVADAAVPRARAARAATNAAIAQPMSLGTPAGQAGAEVDQSIPSRFARQVQQHRDRLAVRSGADSLTYAALDSAANHLAHALLGLSGEGSEPIGMMLTPGTAPVAAILGILKARKFYVPLDPGLPRARLEAIVADAGCRTIVTDAAHLAEARALGHPSWLVDVDALPAGPASDPGLAVAPGHHAYLLYTSGSTGQPKGVVQSHRNVLHQIGSYAKGLAIGAEDRLTLLHSCSLSASRLDIFGALLNGAGLCHFPVAERSWSHLARWLLEERITILHWVPSAFHRWCSLLDGSDRFPGVRHVVLGSETVTSLDVALQRRHFGPGCTFVNRFGTTETGNICWHFVDGTAEIEEGPVPVGRAIDDTEVLVLDEAGADVGLGRVGEIAVASAYLSPGYWRQPELSRSAFAADRAVPGRRIYRTGDVGYRLPDGSLVHTGRRDFQTKIRGHRIEVAEIEAALLAHPAIRDVVVTASEDRSGGGRLLAHVVARGGLRPEDAVLRSFLAARLPAHMLPSGFRWIEELPLTPGGKPDRLALKDVEQAAAVCAGEGAGPRNALEEALVAIWREVLGATRIGVHDSFFDLGGHSLHAVDILARVFRALGAGIQLRDFFDAPTIAAMASIIERKRDESGEDR